MLAVADERIELFYKNCNEKLFFDRSVERISRVFITNGYVQRDIQYKCSNCYNGVQICLR